MMFNAEYENFAQRKIADTIYTLRQMRSAGSLIQQTQDITISASEILTDSLELSLAAAPYLVHLINKGHEPDKFRFWEEALAKMETKYYEFSEAGRHPLSEAVSRFKTGLTVVATNDLNFMTNFFIKGDRVADIEFKDLFDSNLGILAPLSTDILTACLFPEVIRLHSEKIPQVQPVLLSEDLRSITLPKDLNGHPIFLGANRIFVYVDVNNTGDTLKAMRLAAQLEYPGKVIPQGEQRFPR